ncbi:hypothetical protein LTR78_009283 [Recurvomyces mirabilis]|uniref:Cyclin N-terminal domain-containing protein n=1 Tax=Recurvomyces mirabilis TaxID=574656 RepID=A0AAE0WGL0_9PEZI|nr:hypothetical protein LTR78_009283 [Recurvomyces mirabilis]KAK5156156.1 hypothetical protein LTS14_005043 [Recurvomyces mirabilis]
MLLPSPSLSVCDSLDGIDDLDAFLAAQGPLSQFATPPLENKKDVVVVKAVEVIDDVESGGEYVELDHDRVALHFASEAAGSSIYTGPDLDEALRIQDMLDLAKLPPEILALAYNILANYSAHDDGYSLTLHPSDLVVLSTLVLAVDYTTDHAPRTSWWSRNVCQARWTAKQIDKVMLHVCSSLEWNLYSLALPEAVVHGMDRLRSSLPYEHAVPELTHSYSTDSLDHVAKAADMIRTPRMVACNAKSPLRLVPVKPDVMVSMVWAHGQITPNDTPPVSAVEMKHSESCFLRLL